jgi:ParB family chromosome partitioning protein
MSEITWTNTRVRLGDLKPWADNPRMSTKAQARRLLKSFDTFGQVQTIAIGPDYEVYDGHQRLSALLTLYEGRPEPYLIDARQASRPLSDAERRELVVSLHAGAVGGWDWDRVSSWDASELQGWGMDAALLTAWNNDALNLRTMLTEQIDEASAFGALPDEDRAPFQQMTFTLHDTQAEQVREALSLAKAAGAFVDSENENSNGNALARICETYITEHGNS